MTQNTKSLQELGLQEKTLLTLHDAGIESLDELCSKTCVDILKLKGGNRHLYKDIQERLIAEGIPTLRQA